MRSMAFDAGQNAASASCWHKLHGAFLLLGKGLRTRRRAPVFILNSYLCDNFSGSRRRLIHSYGLSDLFRSA